jgi:hypothetical protein
LAHLKWWLMFAGLLVLGLVIAVERLVWRMIRTMFAYRWLNVREQEN